MLLGCVLGALIGALASLFMYAQHYLVAFLWEFLPRQLGGATPVYLFIVCTLGGLLVGLGQKYLGDNPPPTHTLTKKMRSGEEMPGIAIVPASFMLSLVSLGFGGALGPEAALMGIAIGCSTWAVGQMTRYKRTSGLADLPKLWAKIADYGAVLAGMAVFVSLSGSLFNNQYPFFSYAPADIWLDLLVSVVLGLLALGLAQLFEKFEGWSTRLVAPLQNAPLKRGLIGGVILGLLGAVSPLILFSGQVGLANLLTEGQQMAGLFLVLIAVLKMAATKMNTATGWKGGEIFPVMFASAAFGLGLSNLVPAIHPMVAIAAMMAAVTAIVLDNLMISLVVSVLFLPAKLFPFMLVATLTAAGVKKYIVKRSANAPFALEQENAAQ